MSAWEELGDYLNTKCVVITPDPDNGRVDVRKLMGCFKFLCEEIDKLKTSNNRNTDDSAKGE